MAKGVPKAISAYMRKLGRKGGKKSSQALTADQRAKRAQKAAKARWKRQGADRNR